MDFEFFLPVFAVAAVALIAGVGLGIANYFMAVKGNETEERIAKVLPGANCGACGFSGCKGYAEALVSDASTKANLCVVGGDEVTKQVASILGVSAEATAMRCAQVNCRGNCDVTDKRIAYEGLSSCKAALALYGGGGNCRFGCIGYGDCVRACEYDAIQVCNGVAIVNSEACRACGKCADACPKKIITMVSKGEKAAVLCSNTDKGALTKAACKVGCIGCRMCAKVCEHEAIRFEGALAVIDRQKCVGCGACVSACKPNVIVMTK